MYITPKNLREVLKDWEDRTGIHLDVVGFDACFMSMFEMAYELKGRTDYMVASQDEVPDGSFPYGNLVELFRKVGEPVDSLLKEGLRAYVDNYADCICNNATGMRHVTLSVLDLEKCGVLRQPIDSLASALLDAKGDPGLADLLVEARNLSKDYAGGLYVDLGAFCKNLSTLLAQWKGIQGACENVRTALTKGKANLVFDNSAKEFGSGISIYLPYLTNQQYTQVSRPLVKGGTGTRGGKGYTDMLNGAATEYLMCARRSLILDTEGYYPGLLLAKDTRWYKFIAEQWTDALIKTAPADLDYHYSAQQAWINVSRARIAPLVATYV
jgi:Clostripain family